MSIPVFACVIGGGAGPSAHGRVAKPAVDRVARCERLYHRAKLEGVKDSEVTFIFGVSCARLAERDLRCLETTDSDATSTKCKAAVDTMTAGMKAWWVEPGPIDAKREAAARRVADSVCACKDWGCTVRLGARAPDALAVLVAHEASRDRAEDCLRGETVPRTSLLELTRKYTDQICTCTTKQCAKDVMDRLIAETTSPSIRPTRTTPEDDKQLEAVHGKMAQCLSKATSGT